MSALELTLEHLIDETHRRGLRVNNLFEWKPAHWQANLTDGERWYEYGLGATAVEALSNALAKSPDKPAASFLD